MAINMDFGVTAEEIGFEEKNSTTCTLRMYKGVLFMNIPPTFPEYQLLEPSRECYFFEKNHSLYFTLHKPTSGYYITRKMLPHGTNGTYFKTCFPRQLKNKWARKQGVETFEYIPCFFLVGPKEGVYECVYLP